MPSEETYSLAWSPALELHAAATMAAVLSSPVPISVPTAPEIVVEFAPPHQSCALDTSKGAASKYFPVELPVVAGVIKMTPPLGPISPTAQFEVQAATGVFELEDVDTVPEPELFKAETLNMYHVPLVRLVTVALVAVDVPSANVDHVLPELLEYCTT